MLERRLLVEEGLEILALTQPSVLSTKGGSVTLSLPVSLALGTTGIFIIPFLLPSFPSCLVLSQRYSYSLSTQALCSLFV